METKAMTVRLSPDQAEDLETVAQVEGVPVAEVIRRAVSEHIDSRLRDKGFQGRLKAQVERNKRILQKLGKRA